MMIGEQDGKNTDEDRYRSPTFLLQSKRQILILVGNMSTLFTPSPHETNLKYRELLEFFSDIFP